MAEEQPGRELPQRVRGAARTGPPPPPPSSSPCSPRNCGSACGRRLPLSDPGRPPSKTKPREVRRQAPVGARRECRAYRRGRDHRVARNHPQGRRPQSSRHPRSSPRSPPRPSPRSNPLRARLRRILRGLRPGPGLGGRPGSVAAVLVIGVLAVAGVRYFGRSPAGSPTSAAAARQAAEARAAAASWVAQQISRDVKVSCDPAMCAALRAHGFPSRELFVLESTSEVPTSSAVVVETPAVLSLFGSSLAAAWAPAVLASFGSGPFLVTVRVIEP